LKAKKPKSKLVIIDPKENFSKKALFLQAWERLYGYKSPKSMIEWIPPSQGGKLERLDVEKMTVVADFDKFKADVINIIPPQKAGSLAHTVGLAKGDWCPINKATFESTIHKGIHVLGDAAAAPEMPKSGYAANSQAKVAAYAIVEMINGREAAVVPCMNICYSLAGKDYGFTVATVYRPDAEKDILKSAQGGGFTPTTASAENLRREAVYAHDWYNNMTREIYG
jgi:sulfide dehydrogenase [flavocytochrome c] flavoprotein subunit